MMRKPLGRGLDALIGNAAAGIEIGADNDSGAAGAFQDGAGRRVSRAGPFQPRINFDKERLAELTRAIQSQGIIEPLIVRRIAGAPDGGGNRRAALRADRGRAAAACGARGGSGSGSGRGAGTRRSRGARNVAGREYRARGSERGRRRARVFSAGRPFRADPRRDRGARRQEPSLRQQLDSIAGTAAADSEYDREGRTHARGRRGRCWRSNRPTRSYRRRGGSRRSESRRAAPKRWPRRIAHATSKPPRPDPPPMPI